MSYVILRRISIILYSLGNNGNILNRGLIWLDLSFNVHSRASLVAQTVKNLPAIQETLVWSLGWKIPWRRKRQPTPVFLPGKFCGQRNLVGYSSWGCKESDTTEPFTPFTFFLHLGLILKIDSGKMECRSSPVTNILQLIIFQSLETKRMGK